MDERLTGPHSVPGQRFPVSSSPLNVKRVVLGASKGGAQSPRWEMNIPGALPDPTVPPAGCICGCTGCSPKCHPLRPSGGQILAAGASPGSKAAGCCAEQALLDGAGRPRALQTPGGLRAMVWPGRVAPAPPASAMRPRATCERCRWRLHGRRRWCYSFVCLGEQNFLICSSSKQI